MRLTKYALVSAVLIGFAPTDAQAMDRGFWEGAFRRGSTTAYIGAGIGGAGMAMTVGAVASGDPGMALIGGLALWVGAPMMAGGSLRARRGLVELRHGLPGTAGYLAWGLWGVSLGISLAWSVDYSETLLWAFAGTFFGSYLAGGVQMAMNSAQWRRYRPRAAAPSGPVRLRVALAPVAAPGRASLALVGT
jgi:hypothetical protein